MSSPTDDPCDYPEERVPPQPTRYCVEYRIMRNGELRTAEFEYMLQRKLFILTIDTLAEVTREWEEN